MKVKDIMTAVVGYCFPDDTLTKAAGIMWKLDCGIVPVVDAEKKVVGVITDRDICIAAATRDLKPSEVLIKQVITAIPQTCAPDDKVKAALKTMRRARLRRLPVTSQEGALLGIISIADCIRAVRKKGRSNGAPAKRVLAALKALCDSRPPRRPELNGSAPVKQPIKSELSLS
jgi:CBS domain-containing protein